MPLTSLRLANLKVIFPRYIGKFCLEAKTQVLCWNFWLEIECVWFACVTLLNVRGVYVQTRQSWWGFVNTGTKNNGSRCCLAWLEMRPRTWFASCAGKWTYTVNLVTFSSDSSMIQTRASYALFLFCGAWKCEASERRKMFWQEFLQSL